MRHRIAIACSLLLASCGPTLTQGADHPASPEAPAASPPELATALTGDPAPPPETVSPAARSYALDGDVGAQPPVLGITIPAGGSPLPSRPTGAATDSEHEAHAPSEPDTHETDGGHADH